MYDTLRDAIATHPRLVVERPRRASVLVPIVDDDGPPRLVFTRRTAILKRHSGQVAFPGGRLDPPETLIQAALREADEEIGLAERHVEVLGLLDDIPTIYNDTAVTPVVARVRAPPPFIANPTEVARIFEVPLELLAKPHGWRTETRSWENRTYPIYFFDYDGETVWGLTAYVTIQLLALSEFGTPFEVNAEAFR